MKRPDKIVPRNLTARAKHRVSGNPDISRPEDSVSNCFPGLDLDVRSLDRRFFPGLVFEFLTDEPTRPADELKRCGAILLYADPRADPDLRPEYVAGLEKPLREKLEPIRAALFKQLNELRFELEEGTWHLEWIEQNEIRIVLREKAEPGEVPDPMSWKPVWRLVRGLEAGPVTIGLLRRDTGAQIKLEGWRRRFIEPTTGVLSLAYQPGELQMSLCSPWQHDFRDCACHYWSSNRPDVVHPEVTPEILEKHPERAELRLDWMRADRSVMASAVSIMMANRPFQMDHLQINHTWQDLNIVISNTEIGSVYEPETTVPATPYDSPRELYDDLHGRLAPLEMTLALEYLYARFSVVNPRSVTSPTVAAHAEFMRHYLLMIAIGEMHHLRAANELLWHLSNMDDVPAYTPALEPGCCVPVAGKKPRKRELRPLTPEVVDSFILAEQPSGSINGAYARVVATLEQKDYPDHLSELAGRIVNDGVDHFGRFREIRSLQRLYGNDTDYLRMLTPATAPDSNISLGHYEAIKAHLKSSYDYLALGNFSRTTQRLADARSAMDQLIKAGDDLAAKGLGIPFW